MLHDVDSKEKNIFYADTVRSWPLLMSLLIHALKPIFGSSRALFACGVTGALSPSPFPKLHGKNFWPGIPFIPINSRVACVLVGIIGDAN